jgi:hypothetical protein
LTARPTGGRLAGVGRLKQLIGLEARDQRDDEGELIVATCPNGHDLTEGAIAGGDPGYCPECGVDLMPPEARGEGE